MSTDSVNALNALAGLISKSASGVRFAAGAEDGFRLGEIVRARVMRQVGDQSYTMQFKGGERQVDSTIPFRTGDILYGRIVGVGSQVEVERICVERGQADRADLGSDEVGRENASSITQRLQRPLTADETRIVNTVGRGPEKMYLATLAGLALRNLGLGISANAIEGLMSAIAAKAGRGIFSIQPNTNDEASLAESTEAPDHQTQALQVAPMLKALVEDIPEAKSSPDASSRQDQPPANSVAYGTAAMNASQQEMQQDRDPDPDLARWIFNLESGSSVRHRINTIPLMVNGQLIELNVALFQEGDGSRSADKPVNGHKSVVMSFTTPTLGRIEFRATAYGENLSFSLTAEREEVAEQFAAHSTALKSALEQSNWQVAEMTYRHGDSNVEASTHAVLMHLANLDRYEMYV